MMNVPIKIEYLLPLCLIFLLIWILVFHKGEKSKEIKVPPLPAPRPILPQSNQENVAETQTPQEEEIENQTATTEAKIAINDSPTLEQRRQFYANKQQQEELTKKEQELEQAKEKLEYEKQKSALNQKEADLDLKVREKTVNAATKSLKNQIKNQKEKAEIKKEKEIWLNQNDY